MYIVRQTGPYSYSIERVVAEYASDKVDDAALWIAEKLKASETKARPTEEEFREILGLAKKDLDLPVLDEEPQS